MKMTKRIKEALNYFNINLIDHIIIGPDRYYSFSDEHISDL
ncbi:MAG: JAB domain-containing protein [Candidatus Cryptobacteroides sp.]